MKKLMRGMVSVFLVIGLMVSLIGCGTKNNDKTNDNAGNAGTEDTNSGATNAPEDTDATTDEGNSGQEQEPVTILIAAAASMQKSLEELNPVFQEKYPWITVEGTYDSSGKLQIQIEEGMDADVFLSAAMKQMNALKDENLVDAESIVELLENKVVLITPVGGSGKVTGFDDILNAEKIAIGDPASVPAGQYAKEVFESLGIFGEVEKKASLGTNVTEVLNWVAEGSADAGVVYATDAATTDQVTVIAEAPEGTLKQPVIYPVGIVSASTKKEAAKLYVGFLQSAEAAAVLERYGFVVK